MVRHRSTYTTLNFRWTVRVKHTQGGFGTVTVLRITEKRKKTKPAERARRCRPNSAFHSGAGLRLVKQRRHDGLKRLLPFPPGRFESFALHAHSNRRACERRRESAKNSASSQQQQHQQQRAPRTWHVTHVVLCRADICTRPSSVTTSSTLELRAGTEGG